jgi:hypothetical protein
MALVLDPRTGQYIQVPDDSRAVRMQAAAQQSVTGPRGQMAPLMAPTPSAAPLTPAQAYSQGLQTTPPAGMDPDVPTVPGQTWPLQPLQLSPGVVPETQQPVVGARDAAALASTNQGIADALAATKPGAGVLQPAQRGNYNMYNTDTAKLPQPVGAGLTLGFGGGNETARQYLDRMAVVDQQRAADTERANLLRDYNYAANSITPNSSIGEIAAARGRISALAPILAGQVRNQGELATAGVNARAQAASDASRLQGIQLATQGDITSRLLAADITGQYGVQAAQAKGNQALQKVQLEALSPAGRKAAAEAALLETQQNAIAANYPNMTPAQVIAATRSGQEPAGRVYINPITGAPLSEEEIALLQQQQLRQLQPAQ